MPSSRPHTIPTVIHLVRQLQPQSILDVGIGFGKWGHLFREYTDILAAEHEPARYKRENWRVRIDGIEGHAAYLTEMHRFIYNDIHVGDACELLPGLPAYDVVFMGDIIEHLEKQRGQQLVRDALTRVNKAIIISTPKDDTGQENLCGNELERHRSVWSARDFRGFPGAVVRSIEGRTLIAAITKPGVAPLTWKASRQTASAIRVTSQARTSLVRAIPVTEPFVLIDQEQIRGELPHARVFPFLEREGVYWGPPANDEEAIHEIERLHDKGAAYVAIINSCFWFLDHYKSFRKHIEARFPRVFESEALIIFRLREP